MEIPIKKILISEPFRESEVLAGTLETDNRIGSFNIVDYPLGYEYIHENDFVIIGGSNWFIEKDKRLQILHDLSKKKVAGIGVYLSRFGGYLPKDMKELAKDLGLLILSLGAAGERLSYEEILNYFSDNFFILTSDKFINVDYIQMRFYECYKNNEYECIANRLWAFTGKDVYIRKNDEEYFCGQKNRIKRIVDNKNHWIHLDKISLQEKDLEINSFKLTMDGETIFWIGNIGKDRKSNSSIFGLFSETDGFDTQDIRIFRYALQALNMTEARKQKEFKQIQSKNLQELLSEQFRNSKNVELELSQNGIYLGMENFVFTVAGKINQDSINIIHHETKKLLVRNQEVKFSPIISEYENCLVFIVPRIKDKKRFINEIMDILMKYSPDGTELRVGVGAIVSLKQLLSSYEEAKIAVFWAKAHKHERVVEYEKLGILQVINRNNNLDDVESFRTRYIKKIKDYDHANNTDLYNTLRIHVNNLWSYSQASKVLFIHLNTVKYRIKQIEKIVGLDFTDQNERLIIELSLKLDEVLLRY